jgi:hypothetical protein
MHWGSARANGAARSGRAAGERASVGFITPALGRWRRMVRSYLLDPLATASGWRPLALAASSRARVTRPAAFAGMLLTATVH